MSGRTIIIRGHAASLPLPAGSADLIVTSPPYFGLRSYTDGGEHYDGQIGSEPSPAAYLEALWACTAEWMRVLKPEGSLFINLGDKYAGNQPRTRWHASRPERQETVRDNGQSAAASGKFSFREHPDKSLLGLPWRYALGCMDRLGLILRAEIIWDKPNGLPESVTDRVRRSHEQVFHFTRQPRYYAAVDEIREAHVRSWGGSPNGGHTYGMMKAPGEKDANLPVALPNPLGKLPRSVWAIPSAPLTVPPHLGVDHFAAYPPELVRRIILGWSPPAVCTACGQGRRPVTKVSYELRQRTNNAYKWSGDEYADGTGLSAHNSIIGSAGGRAWRNATITGYACACTPHTDHPGTGERDAGDQYHLDGWTPPPARPAVVVDPFGGTGTAALVAAAYGRVGVTIDLSHDYCRLARWRTRDPGERARAMQVPKPPPVPSGQEALFSTEELSAS